MTADDNILQDPDCKNDPIFSVDIRFVSNNLLCLGFVIFRTYCILNIQTQAILGELPEGVLPPALLLTLCAPSDPAGGELRFFTDFIFTITQN